MVKIAFSYSHADETLRNELEKHLTSLKRQGLINTWHDRCILAGQEFNGQIDKNFEDADVILLLVSPDFIASDYCYNTEMNRAIERHNQGRVTVVPIILRPCDWHDLPFGKLLAATKDGKAIVNYPTLDHGFLEVTTAIKQAIKAIDNNSNNIQEITNPSSKILPTITNHSQRSSNLRIRQKFTDQDRDLAKIQCFDYIAGYFQNSLDELCSRNRGVNFNFNRVDSNSFEATIYLDGKRISYCGIWIESGRGVGGDIFYSTDGITRNSYNEIISIQDDGYNIGFKAVIGNYNNSREVLTGEGVSEHLWSMFIQYLK